MLCLLFQRGNRGGLLQVEGDLVSETERNALRLAADANVARDLRTLSQQTQKKRLE